MCHIAGFIYVFIWGWIKISSCKQRAVVINKQWKTESPSLENWRLFHNWKDLTNEKKGFDKLNPVLTKKWIAKTTSYFGYETNSYMYHENLVLKWM